MLGLDPGTLVTGFGVVSRTGGRMTMLACGSIRNRAGTPMASRLRKIHDELSAVIDRHKPDEFAIESAFYGKNAQSALKLGHARGAAMLAAVRRGLGSTEYSPREVKKAVTGSGTASKAQVRYMVRSILSLGDARVGLDESDALAIAICHMHRLSGSAVSHRNWASYVAAHPERVIT
ncbi:MAG TPA: crossover junction endodeoxyribonuclease RuvC [Bacteroidota bacterium]|nr:crossover junction endodeoxyribonuclease RuvC [Bacteroidota bacterium]